MKDSLSLIKLIST